MGPSVGTSVGPSVGAAVGFVLSNGRKKLVFKSAHADYSAAAWWAACGEKFVKADSIKIFFLVQDSP